MADWKLLITSIQAGKSSTDELYRETRADLLPILERRIPAELKSRWTAEDLLHEVFLRAVESIGRFEWRGEASWRSFLLTIAQHCIQDALRRKSRLDVRFRTDSEPGGVRPSELAASDPSASKLVAQAESLEAVLSRLQPSDAHVIRLKALKKLSDEELAQALGKTVAAAHQAFKRAMNRFKAAGRELWPDMAAPADELDSSP